MIWSGLALLPNQNEAKLAASQSTKPRINHVQTQSLFESISRKSLGATFDIELKTERVFTHPGRKPTEAVFDIRNKFQALSLVGSTIKLPADGLADPQAGTVGMEIFVDGKSKGRRLVDRLTNQTFNLDLTNAKELKVVVDCANGTADWDHFYLGVAKE